MTAGDAFGTVFSNNPGFNNAGQTAFVDTLVTNATLGAGDILTANNVTSGANANNGGTFAEANGTIRTVAQKGSQAAGQPAGAVYSSFGNAILNDAGKVAFTVSLANSANGTGGIVGSGAGANSAAVYSEAATGTLSLVAQAGSVAPGTPGDTFSGFGSTFALNTIGELLFGGTLATGVGDVTGTTNNTGLWAEEPGGTVDLLIRNGQAFQVAPGDVRTVSAIQTNVLDALSGGEDGRPSLWNDSGTVPVALTFTNGTSGVFTLQLATTAVPEPAATAVVVVGGLLSLGRRRAARARRLPSQP